LDWVLGVVYRCLFRVTGGDRAREDAALKARRYINLAVGRDGGFTCTIKYSSMGIDWIAAAWRAARVTLRAWWRVARQLFHEMTGALFGLFAISGGLAAWRQWNHVRVPWLLAATIAYSLMMAIFCFVSFRNARRVR
jgi:hypothetical protein